jgi:uncharacterized protein (DUF488 family)
LYSRVRVFTVGHGARPAEELVRLLTESAVRTLVDVRLFPGSRRHPQFGKDALREKLARSGIAYLHLAELGGRRSNEPGEERFGCIRVAAFRSYAARMSRPEWQAALREVVAQQAPAVMCAETPWWRCHRRLIAEQLSAAGHEVVHLIRPGDAEPHRKWDIADYRGGRLYLCGEPVAVSGSRDEAIPFEGI